MPSQDQKNPGCAKPTAVLLLLVGCLAAFIGCGGNAEPETNTVVTPPPAAVPIDTVPAVAQQDVIGNWHEQKTLPADYTMFRKDGKVFLRMRYENGQTADEEMKVSKVSSGTRYDYKGGGFNDEYFVLNRKGELDFYNKENKKFTTGTKTEMMQ